MDDNAFPEGSARGNEPCVMLASGLIERVVLQRLEVKRRRKVEGVIGDGPSFSLRRRTDDAALEVRDLREKAHFGGKEVSLCRTEILAKPEEGAMDEHGV